MDEMQKAALLLWLFGSLFIYSECKWLSHYDIAKPCVGLKDGDYPLADLFTFLHCKNHEATYMKCEKEKVFDPESKTCIDGKDLSLHKFCDHRTDGNWQNPWDCNKFIQCVRGRVYVESCPEHLVYDPLNDECRNDKDCKQLEGLEEQTDVCQDIPDGDYSIRDVLSYLHCNKNIGEYKECPHNQIFEPGQKICVDASTQNNKTLCLNRTNGDYSYPWNCHKFFKCLTGYFNPYSCSGNLVFNPYKDQCVYPNEYPCKQVEGEPTRFHSEPENPCEKLEDGSYPIRNVMKYLKCKDHKAIFLNCSTGQIFDPLTLQCIDASKVSKTDFCVNRDLGDWSNPWDCNSFYKCWHNITHLQPCQHPELHLVFDPYLDQCVFPQQYDCKELPKDNRNSGFCSGKSDGDYAIPHHVFKYTQCKGGVATNKTCDDEYIFDEKSSSCISIIDVSTDNFCKGRDDGNWENPFYCRRFWSCNSGVTTNKPCFFDTWIYNPDKDTCVLPGTYPCHSGENDHIISDSSACSELPDGVYPIRNVRQYLKCKDHQGTKFDCSSGLIFDPHTKECIEANTVSVENFCEYRANGDWSNPWNCSGFFKCWDNKTHPFDCQRPDLNLVYNPDTDQCVYPAQYDCTPIPSKETDCSKRKDGNYVIRNVLSYLQCRDRKATIMHCPEGFVYEEILKSCVHNDISSAQKICLDVPDGNYKDPWDCNGYIACTGHRPQIRKCRTEEYIYNPERDMCEHPGGRYECVQYAPPDTIPMVLSRTNDSLCKNNKTLKPIDRMLVTVSPFQYLNCTGGKSRLITCPKNQIYAPTSEDDKVWKCQDVTKNGITIKNFCKGRLKMSSIFPCWDWFLDPWDCNLAITCITADHFSPQGPAPGNKYHYNPAYQTFNSTKCTQLPTSKSNNNNNVNIHDICTTIQNGLYPIRDVLKYLECNNGVSTVVDCPPNTIYVAGKSTCTAASAITENNFCEGRLNGNWRNPWNCSTYFTCTNNQIKKTNCNDFIRLNYDPVMDKCDFPTKDNCPQLKSSYIGIADDFCKGKADGSYAKGKNVFDYITCKNGKSSDAKCPRGQFFSPGDKKCVDAGSQSIAAFCAKRKDGDWQDPWNCNRYMLCEGHITLVRPCLINGFVFDPDMDVCRKTYPCETIYGQTSSLIGKLTKSKAVGIQAKKVGKQAVAIKDICTTLDDGNYATRDVLSILQCTNKTSKMVDCPKDTIYVSGKNCTDAKKINEGNFCDGRPEGNYRNPWDCHSYYVCRFGHPIHKQNCSIYVAPKRLNYDPDLDSCGYPDNVPCKQLVSNTIPPHHAQDDDMCKGKDDGNYPKTRFAFVYIACKGGKGTETPCPEKQIFSPADKKCVAATSISPNTFCKGRDDGDWQNPWDCFSFLVCRGGYGQRTPCMINQFIFDPEGDVCRKGIACNIASTTNVVVTPTKMPMITDICSGLDNGNYSTREVFSFLECKNKTSKYHDCPAGTLYVTGNNCTNATKITTDNFCDGRVEGNYRNPWNCHEYLTCRPGHPLQSTKCNLFVTLNYQPALDTCVYPADDPKHCPQIKQQKYINRRISNNVNDDPCSSLKDGDYEVRDVAKYLTCKNHKGSFNDCAKGEIYQGKKCVSIKEVKPAQFCVGRTDGNYRNPWNCHNYFTCHAEHAFDRPCSKLTVLNYDPDKDICDFPYQHKCQNISSVSQQSHQKPINPIEPCANLPNGRYPIKGDVFKYTQCTRGKGVVKSCRNGKYFDAVLKKCVRDNKEIRFTKTRSERNKKISEVIETELLVY